MKKAIRIVSAFTLGATLLAPAGHALASDGTVTLSGALVATTCSGATGESGLFSVTLPKISTKTLSATGKTAGDTGFHIILKGCSQVTGNVATYFEPGATVDTLSGRLKNTSDKGSAANVQIEFVNASDATPILNGYPPAQQNSLSVSLVSDAGTPPTGQATLFYIARYYATGVATAGKVASQFTYSMVVP